MTDLRKRLTSAPPKRILALDGGGIRGCVCLGYLERLEEILRRRLGAESFVLADYFDLIGGTSTGAIIAACLAMGMSASQVKKSYLQLGGEVFGHKRWDRWNAKFDDRPLQKCLRDVFGSRTLGDPEIRTGLCIVTKRADTGSTWPLLNNPDGKFYQSNQHIPLVDALRASTAAPTFFMPMEIRLGDDFSGVFVDGGVSMANNPSMQLLMIASLKGFGLHWAMGEDKLLLASVGTGFWKVRDDPMRLLKGSVLTWASRVPSQLIDDASQQNQLLLQWMSRSPTAGQIDLEVGDLNQDLLAGQPLLHYLRYNIPLEQEALRQLGFTMAEEAVSGLRDMSDATHRHLLAQIGQAAARQDLCEEHFPPSFDPHPDSEA
jgi:patatin-like phospholipase/acyl hydrolase